MAAGLSEGDHKGSCTESLDLSEAVIPLQDLTPEGSYLEEINVVSQDLFNSEEKWLPRKSELDLSTPPYFLSCHVLFLTLIPAM